MRILSGDIGGTNSRFALYEVTGDEADGERFECLARETLSSAEHASLDHALQHLFETWLERSPGGITAVEGDLDGAAFGVPGPVIDGRCRTTNLPWTVDAASLATRLGLARVVLLNDLEAQAHGLMALEEHEIHVLHAGRSRPGNAALIAAGTGLGQAGLLWDGRRHVPFATEGGHASFAPRDDLEIELLRFLGETCRLDDVSFEDVVSGTGLVRLHDFVVARRGRRRAAAFETTPASEQPALVSRLGRTDACPSCREAVELFVGLYGAEAGNLALKTMAVAGVWIGGGIAPKLLELLRAGGAFRRAFCAKGPMRSLLEDIPLRVVLTDDTALRGAARVARGLER